MDDGGIVVEIWKRAGLMYCVGNFVCDAMLHFGIDMSCTGDGW